MKTAHEAIAAMKAELERRKVEAESKFGYTNDDYDCGQIYAYSDFLPFLDILEAEARKHNIALANTDAPKDPALDSAFNDIWMDVESLESVKSLPNEQQEKLKEAAHDLFESGAIWKKEQLGAEGKEVDLEKFTEKINTFQSRYKLPESISVKGAMAFMARMFYQYPNTARQWYDSLPKATMD